MTIPEDFTHRGNSNEQPPETYDKGVEYVIAGRREPMFCSRANALAWKIPDGPMRIIAYKVRP